MMIRSLAALILSVSHAQVLSGRCWTREGGAVLVARDIPYQKSLASQKLDIYVPANSAPPFKVVLSLHGGCFQWGSKSAVVDMEQIKRFTAAGYAVASVDYRLADPGNAVPSRRNLFPASLEDAEDALRWLRLNGKTYRLQTEKVIAFGYSAGATLAAYLGTRPVTGSARKVDHRASGDPVLSAHAAGVIDFFGRTDFSKSRPNEARADDGRDCAEEYLGQTRTEANGSSFEDAGVLGDVDATAARFLILHGTKDVSVSPDHSELLARKLEQTAATDGDRKVKAALFKIEGAGHMFNNPREMDEAWSHVCSFLTEVLGPPNSLTDPPAR